MTVSVARRALLLAAGLVVSSLAASAQAPSDVVFDPASVSRIDIAIDPDSLQWVFDHPLSDREVPADFSFTRGSLQETVPNVGFRLRGNTSRQAQKKSFKVSLNTFVSGRAWRGLEKLNLNGEHNDPTIARSALSWALFADVGAVASRAGHTEVYLNDAYYGLYINVEHLDETFLQREFGTEGGFLFKCLYPADLAYRGPTGASYQHTDGTGRPVYELSQGGPVDEGYDALARFVAVLNQTPTASFPTAIEEVLDVNAFLEVLAADVVLGAWDDYWYNQNNFYLRFDPATERVTYVPYDYDNTLGIDFVGRDWGTRNPYAWGNTGEPRPLATRVLAVPEFRARFTFYLRQMLGGTFQPVVMNARIDALETLLTPYAEADPFRPLDYGLTGFVATRHASLLVALDATNVPPIVHRPAVQPARPTPADALTFTARVEDEAPLASVVLRTTVGAGTAAETPMRDDGADGDATAGDGVFTAILPAVGAEASVAYSVTATDAIGQVRASPLQTVDVAAPAAGLVVNEFLASNETGLVDEAGEAEDWIEIYNPTADPVSLLGYTLTDDLAVAGAWAFPDTTLAPGAFLLVWADDDLDQGPLHASFKLSASGEAVGLFAAGAPVDSYVYGPQTTDVSTGRLPDGSGAFVVLVAPTPGASNSGTIAADAPPAIPALRVYPNPFADALVVETGAPGADVAVFDVLGRLVQRLRVPDGATSVVWDGGATVAPGLCLVRVTTADGVRTAMAVRR